MKTPQVIDIVSRKQLKMIVPEAGTPATANGYVEANARGSGISLAETLERHGIEFREQPPDANGFTWYHVEQCPFHDDGRPFECGVGQRLPDGPFAGHCFHPEGQGQVLARLEVRTQPQRSAGLPNPLCPMATSPR